MSAAHSGLRLERLTWQQGRFLEAGHAGPSGIFRDGRVPELWLCTVGQAE